MEKLSAATKSYIVRFYNCGFTCKDLAWRYRVSPATIGRTLKSAERDGVEVVRDPRTRQDNALKLYRDAERERRNSRGFPYLDIKEGLYRELYQRNLFRDLEDLVNRTASEATRCIDSDDILSDEGYELLLRSLYSLEIVWERDYIRSYLDGTEEPSWVEFPRKVKETFIDAIRKGGYSRLTPSDIESINSIMVQVLNKREVQALKLRYGLEDGEKRKLREVGEILSISMERVRQIQEKALARLRGSGRLKVYTPGIERANLRDQVSLSPLLREAPDYSTTEVPAEAHMNKSVYELALSEKVRSALNDANISAVKDLVQRSEGDLLLQWGIGKKSLEEIKEALALIGLSLR